MSSKIRLLVILDEIDQVRRELNELIYNLTRINDELRDTTPVSFIAITNDVRIKNRFDPGTKSTLCEENIAFKPYNANEIAVILKQRVSDAFQDGVIDEGVISFIAGYAARDGNARYALRLLEKSGMIAQERNADRITIEHVEEAKKAVEEDIMSEIISTLPEHQQIVVYSIASLTLNLNNSIRRRRLGISINDLFTGEVYDAYEQNCKILGRTPRTERQFGDYINELEMLGVITTRPSGKGIRGNTTLIRLSYPPEKIRDIMKKTLWGTEITLKNTRSAIYISSHSKMTNSKKTEAIKNVLKQANEALWIREISRRSRIPIATTIRCIKEMEKKGIVKSGIRGKIKEVRLVR